MRRLLAILAVCCLCAGYAAAAEDPEQPADDAAQTEPKAAQDGETAKPAEADADIKPEPANLKDRVKRSLKLFVPSEEIDVDKPVDFPTNI